VPEPAILVVDDDDFVLDALADDLRPRYEPRYRVLLARTGEAGIEALRELRLRGEPVALVIAAHRMADVTGLELLARSRELSYDARRVLLTAFAEADAAIRASNAAVDHYLLKPWQPPDELLYPALDDLLEAWKANHRTPFGGVRLLGHRWSSRSHELRELLARNHVPYQWIDVEDPEAAPLLESVDAGADDIPLVLLPDGQPLRSPPDDDLLDSLGVHTRPEQQFYDVVIVGGGPAGLAAAVYASSEGLRALLVERKAPGGQAGTSSHIANYPGFPTGIGGGELARRTHDQARAFGTEILVARAVDGLEVNGSGRTILLDDGSRVDCHAVVIATGVAYNQLDAPGARDLTGAGVFYGAAAAEAGLCRGQRVFLLGGGNSAGQAAAYLAEVASSVTLVSLSEVLSENMSHYLVDQLEALPNVEIRLRSTVARCEGGDHLERITIQRVDTGEDETVDTNLLFVFIGAAPHTDWLGRTLVRDDRGYIITGRDARQTGYLGWPLDRDPFPLETSVPGVLAAGDVRRDSLKRVVAAVGEGGMAVHQLHRYLRTAR